jgi:hypothetical protein
MPMILSDFLEEEELEELDEHVVDRSVLLLLPIGWI